LAIIRNILVRVGANITPYQRNMATAQRTTSNWQTMMRTATSNTQLSMQSIGSSLTMGKLGFVALGAAAVASFALVSTKAAKTAMEYESSMQQINRIMGKNTAGFVEWTNTQASSFNMSRLEAVKYGAVYGNLMGTITSDQAKATQYTTDLLKASAVVASATGRDMTDVMERIRSGLLGNTEAIEDLGINVNVALLQSTETFRKFANGKSWDQLDFRTQQQIRLFGILEQATSKFGNDVYKNTASGLTRFTSLLKDAQLNLGQAFLPIINIATPILISFAENLKYVTSVFSQFMQALFGVDSQQAQNAKSAADATAAQAKLGDSAKKAGDKAKKGVAGFDQLNLLQENLAASASSAADALGSGAASTPEKKDDGKSLIPKGILDAAEKAKKALKPISVAFDEYKESLKNLGKSIRENPHIQAWFERFKTDMKNVGTGGILAWSGALRLTAGVINIAAGALSGDFETALKGAEQAVSGTFDIVTGIMYPFFPNIAQKMQEFKKDFGQKWASLKEDVKTYGDPTKLEAMDFAMYIRDNVSKKWDELKINTGIKWDGIKDTISEKWSQIKGFDWDNVGNSLSGTWDNLKIKTGNVWDEIGNNIKDSVNLIIDSINYLIKGMNKIKLDVPDWMPEYLGGGQSLGGNIPLIPKLANGGMAYGPTLAKIGDNKQAFTDPEVIAPLSGLQEKIEYAVSNAMASNRGNNSGDTTVILKLGESELGRAVIKAVNSVQRQTGKTLLSI